MERAIFNDLGELPEAPNYGMAASDEQLSFDADPGVPISVDERSPEEKLARIRAIATEPFDGKAPDVIINHSGGMAYSEKLGVFRSTSFSPEQLTEHGLATGGRVRVIATARLAEALPEVPILTNSFNRFDPTWPTMAEVTKQELVRRGVVEDRISKEEDSFSTITQLVEMVNLAVEQNWERITAVVTEFHVPRVREMFDNLDTIIDDADFQRTLATYKERGVQISILPAETVLREVSSRFVDYFDQVAASEPYQRTLAAEAQGLTDLRAGKYRVVLRPETPRD